MTTDLDIARNAATLPIMDIAEYCCFDVKVTKLVHEYGARHGMVKYKNRFNQSLEIPVDWKMPAS